jgi:hypothetical protein
MVEMVKLWRWRAQRTKGDSRTGWRAFYGVQLFSAIVGYIALQNSEYFDLRKQNEKEKVEYPIEIANLNLNTTNKVCTYVRTPLLRLLDISFSLSTDIARDYCI